MQIQELKRTITEIKNSLLGFNSTWELAEERIHELEDKSIETVQCAAQSEKRASKELGDTTKCTYA